MPLNSEMELARSFECPLTFHLISLATCPTPYTFACKCFQDLSKDTDTQNIPGF